MVKYSNGIVIGGLFPCTQLVDAACVNFLIRDQILPQAR